MAGPPCEPSEWADFRKRIGEQGIEPVLKESIRINEKDVRQDTVSIDTTVQEKNITFPADGKLHRKIIVKCWKIARQNNMVLRRSYKRILKKLALVRRLRHHRNRLPKPEKQIKKVKVIAGRLVREKITGQPSGKKTIRPVQANTLTTSQESK